MRFRDQERLEEFLDRKEFEEEDGLEIEQDFCPGGWECTCDDPWAHEEYF